MPVTSFETISEANELDSDGEPDHCDKEYGAVPELVKVNMRT
jgi:hypothetical protein